MADTLTCMTVPIIHTVSPALRSYNLAYVVRTCTKVSFNDKSGS